MRLAGCWIDNRGDGYAPCNGEALARQVGRAEDETDGGHRQGRDDALEFERGLGVRDDRGSEAGRLDAAGLSARDPGQVGQALQEARVQAVRCASASSARA